MTKLELTEHLTMKLNRIKFNQMKLCVDSIIDLMSESLAKGEHIEIRGFGSFTLRQRKARMSRNPKTGAPCPLEATTGVHFKPGKLMRERVNGQ